VQWNQSACGGKEKSINLQVEIIVVHHSTNKQTHTVLIGYNNKSAVQIIYLVLTSSVSMIETLSFYFTQFVAYAQEKCHVGLLM
jgi:hypothetical protein